MTRDCNIETSHSKHNKSQCL